MVNFVKLPDDLAQRIAHYAREHPKTNADRIRAMTDEELAVQLAFPLMATPPWCSEHDLCPYMNEDHDAVPCDKCALDWLKQKAGGGAE